MSNGSYPVWMLELKYEGTSLTKNEAEILRLLAMGYTQVQIAQKRHRSPETIKTQTKVLRARLKARTNAHAVAIALSLDLI